MTRNRMIVTIPLVIFTLTCCAPERKAAAPKPAPPPPVTIEAAPSAAVDLPPQPVTYQPPPPPVDPIPTAPASADPSVPDAVRPRPVSPPPAQPSEPAQPVPRPVKPVSAPSGESTTWADPITTAMGLPPNPAFPGMNYMIKVDISEQKLYLLDNEQVVKTYPVSTSKYGIGGTQGSNKTPLGRHVVAEKIGDGAPLNTIFKSRQNTGRLAKIDYDSEEDYVTTRILWLQGLEQGVNLGPGVDSHKRYIYIHGTHEEALIGQPASHGCIRMRNQDVLELFNRVPEGIEVLISG